MKSPRRNEITVELNIVNLPYDPDELSKEMGIQATSVQRFNDLSRSGKPYPNPTNAWSFSTGWKKVTDINEPIRELIKSISPYIPDAIKTNSKFIMSCGINIETHEDQPIISLDLETIKLLASLNCEVDYDYYIFPWKYDVEGFNHLDKKIELHDSIITKVEVEDDVLSIEFSNMPILKFSDYAKNEFESEYHAGFIRISGYKTVTIPQIGKVFGGNLRFNDITFNLLPTPTNLYGHLILELETEKGKFSITGRIVEIDSWSLK